MIGTMKTNLKKIFALSLISFALCGCNEGANVAIPKVGFDKCIGTSSPTPQVGLAFTSKSKQSLNAAFNVYVGGLVATGVFALTAGIYYMLWVNESNFAVEELTFSGGYGGANIAYTYRW